VRVAREAVEEALDLLVQQRVVVILSVKSASCGRVGSSP
jgi:hypothetical protein